MELFRIVLMVFIIGYNWMVRDDTIPCILIPQGNETLNKRLLQNLKQGHPRRAFSPYLGVHSEDFLPLLSPLVRWG